MRQYATECNHVAATCNHKFMKSFSFTLGIRLAYNRGMKNFWLFLPFLLSACASAPELKSLDGSLPDWVQHPEKNYPSTRYLVAVGSGNSRDEAIRDARKQMAESFVVKVQSLTQVNSQSKLAQNTSGQVSGDANQNVSKDLSLETTTHLRGAEVKEVSSVDSQIYALVALDKLSARSGLLMEANRIQADINSELDGLDQRFTKAGYNHAKSLMANFQELQGEASALGMSALLDLSPIQARILRIENSIRGQNQKLAFTVTTLKGESFFEKDIEACINDRGGMVYSLGKEPTGTNQIQITVTERPQHLALEGFSKIRFDLSASVIQANGQKYQAQTTQTETGRSRKAILEAVSDKLSQDLCEQVFNRVSEMKPVGKE